MKKTTEERGGRGRISAVSRRSPLATAESREPREQADADRTDDGLELTQEMREQMLRDDALQNQLPVPPARKGIHWFWASMTNQWTTVSWYMRMGYKPVKFEQLAGWADANMRGKSGDYAGCITVNEMLLMQIEESYYQRYMKVIHHEKPLEEQRRMKESFERVREEVSMESGHEGLVGDGAAKGEMSGVSLLERTAKRPSKFE